MRCARCGSPRLVKFVDGFGEVRFFCKNCWGSFSYEGLIEYGKEVKLNSFKGIFHDNPRAVKNW